MGISKNALLVVGILGASFPTQVNAARPDSVSKTERRIKAVFDTASPAVVRIEGKRHLLGSGIILTPEGHILTRDDIVRENLAEEISVTLKDGRRLTANPLGWSGEWKVGLLKVESELRFPCVPLGDKQAVAKAGHGCVAIGYPKQLHARNAPIARYGCVSLGCDTMWCTATCPVWSMGDFGAGLFDLDGRLLGICVAIPTNDDALFALVDAVESNWGELASGKNLDALRLLRKNQPKVPSLQTASTGEDEDTAQAATVRLTPEARNWSGVVVTPDGYIATCAHHKKLPGDKVTVSFSDGRQTTGQVLGMNRVTDVGLVKITNEGRWPHARMGLSAVMDEDTEAIIMGFPHSYDKAGPLVRRTKIVPAPGRKNVHSIWLYTDRSNESSRVRGGDSGGGLFDNHGRHVGIHKGVFPHQTHVRVEALKRQWGLLAAAEPVRKMESPNPHGVESEFISATRTAQSGVVDVLCDGRPACVGIVVNADGQIITKHSRLFGRVSCRLSDGVLHEAKIVKTSKDDLALLRVDANDLPVALWSDANPSRHSLVAGVLPHNSLSIGLVTRVARRIPGEPGHLGPLRNTAQGLELFDDGVAQHLGMPLKKHDVIISVAGHPTPNLESMRGLMRPGHEDFIGYAGDRVAVTVRRGQDTVDLLLSLAPTNTDPRVRESRRNTGFSTACDSDMKLSPTQLGAPIVDTSGSVTGVAIATIGRGQIHILPASVLRAFLPQLHVR